MILCFSFYIVKIIKFTVRDGISLHPPQIKRRFAASVDKSQPKNTPPPL